MAKDFRASQIRSSILIASGTDWPTSRQSGGFLKMVVAPDTALTNYDGTFTATGEAMFKDFGQEPWLVFSGAANTSQGVTNPGQNPPGSAVLFLGDVIISGTLFGKRQVINIDRTVDGDFSVHDKMFVSGNVYMTPTSFAGDTADVITVLAGDGFNQPRVLFRKADSDAPHEYHDYMGNNKKNSDAFVIFSGSKGQRLQDSGSIVLMEGDLHVSGNVSVEGNIDLGLMQRDFILNNSASRVNIGGNGLDGAFPDDYALPGGSGKGAFTTAGPRFGHATTGALAPGADHDSPFFIQEDAWQVWTKAVLPHGAGTIPAFWYSDFVNSSSLDQQGVGVAPNQRLGGFRFIVAASGSGTNYLNDGRGAANSSVFTISGSGDIAVDPGKGIVFDSRAQSLAAGNPELYRRVQILHVPGSGLAKSKLIFSGAAGKPLHYVFARGEVTGSGGFHLPKNAGTLQGQMGQLTGITFQGNAADGDAPEAAIFYNMTAGENTRFPWKYDNTLVITSSSPDGEIKIGSGDTTYIYAGDNIELKSWDNISVLAGYLDSGDAPASNGSLILGARSGITAVGNRGFDWSSGGANITEYITFTTHHLNSANDFSGEGGGYTWQLNSSGSSYPPTGYLMMSGSGNDGAHTIKTVGTSNNSHLTIKPDGHLFMTGSKAITIDPGPLDPDVYIGTAVNTTKIQVGHGTLTNTTEIELNANNVDVNAGSQYTVNATGIVAMTGTTSATVRASGGNVLLRADGADGAIHLQADDQEDGVQIATDTSVPVTIGGSASTVTIGNNLSVGTMAHSGSVDIWGNLVVHGDFIKGHVISASMEDPLLQLNSGSTVANSGGGVSIASGSSAVFTNAQGNWNFSMVFGRDTTTSRDHFLVGRKNTEDGHAIDLSSATPIDIRAAGFRTAAGMTLTSSNIPGGAQVVKVGNTGSAGKMVVHAGTTDGGGSLGPLVFSGSSMTFYPAQRVYLDDDSSKYTYFQSRQGGSSNRLDLQVAGGLRLNGAPTIQFGNDNLEIKKDLDNLLVKAATKTIAFSGSNYSFDMSSTENLYFQEGADAVKWRVHGNMLKLDMEGSNTGLMLSEDLSSSRIYFASTAKAIDGTGQRSNSFLTYKTDDQITIKSHGDSSALQPSRATVYATGQDENDDLLAGNGGILIMSGTGTATPWNGFASLGYTSTELDALGVMEGKHTDVTLIFSGSQGQFPSKTTRGTSLFMGDVVFSGSVAVGNYIYHEGQEDATSGAPQTAIELQDRGIKLIASGTELLHADAQGSIKSFSVNPDNGYVSTQIKGYSAGADKPIMMALAHDTSNRATFFNPFSTDNPNVDPANGHDVQLFFSGSKNTRYSAGDTGAAVRGTALFGGDVVISGALGVGTFELGNLTLTNANAYLRFYDSNHFVQKNGNDLEFRDNNLGSTKTLTALAATAVSTDLFSVSRTATNRPNYGMTTGSFSFDTGFAGAAANSPRSAAQASINSSGEGNSDVYFFVSGAIGSKAKAPSDFTQAYQRRAVALFGGDVHISGTLTSNNTTFRSSLDMAYDTNNSGFAETGGGSAIIADSGYVDIKKAAVNPVSLGSQALLRLVK